MDSLDTQALLWLNSLHADWLDQFIFWLSSKLVWIPFYVAIAAMVVLRWGWRRGLIIIAAIGLAVACADLVCARLIRPFFERLRPANIENPISPLVHIVNGYRGGRYGFPSCHAANSFALAMSSALLLRSRGYAVAIFAWAVMQCYTRIYLGVHYPGDILVGAFVGMGLGLLAALAANATIERCDWSHRSGLAARADKKWLYLLPLTVMLASIAVCAVR